MKDNATPRPWTMEDEHHPVVTDHRILGTESDGRKVIIAHGVPQRNAELIVRAVNSHDKLVEALQEIYSTSTIFHSDQAQTARIHQIAEEALKLAKP